MIFDGFIFFNEIELLELRLKIMWEHVDRFIIVEAGKTFTNQDKELYFEINKKRFEKYMDKIEYVVIDEFPDDCKNAWDCEYYQRNSIYKGIKNADPDDILIVSDLDEIISPYGLKRIKKILSLKPDVLLRVEHLTAWYYLNYVDQKTFFWSGSTAYTISEAEKYHREYFGEYPLDEKGRISPQTARSWRNCITVPCAGWHFSYIGGIESIKKKIRSFSHQEFNTEEWLDDERIMDMIKSGKDLFDRGLEDFVSIPIDRFMPDEVKNNYERYKDLICDIRPISPKTYMKLRIKYFFETTFLRSLFHAFKKLR